MASESISGAGRVRVSLADVLITEELARRSPRQPDYSAENRAFAALAKAMSENPETILSRLAEIALELCGAHSAGISVLDPPGPSAMCRWSAIAGRLAAFTGGAIPRDTSPCAIVLENGTPTLFSYPTRRFDYGMTIDPPVVEMLLSPFHIEGTPTGAIWVIAHSEERKFDAEDQRLLMSLARFASAAYQLTTAMETARAARAVLEQRVEERTAALRAAETQNRRLIDANIIGVLSVSSDGLIFDANDAFLTMTGYTRDDVTAGLRWDAITLPAPSSDNIQFSRAAQEGRLPPYETDFIHKSGVRVPALVGAAFLDEISGQICFVLDITERRRRELDERFLANLDMTLRHLSDLDDVGNAVANAVGAYFNGRCILSQSIDESGVRILNSVWSSDGTALAGRYSLRDFLTPGFEQSLRRGDAVAIHDVRSDPRTAEHAANFLSGGVAALITVPWLQEGRWRGNLTIISPEPRVWDDRETTLLRAVAARIWPLIEHTRILRELQESETRLRLFIDQAPAAIAMLDREMRYLAASRRWLSDYGLSGQDLNGLSHFDIFPDLPDGWREVYRRALNGETLTAEEDWVVRRDGVLVWLKWEVRPWHSNGGAIGGIVIFTEDISSRKQAEAALRTLNETLEQRIAERTSESELRAAQLRMLATELTEVEQRERRQLASILHDHLQQSLVSARMHLRVVDARTSDQEVKQTLEKIDLLLDQCIIESQSLSHQLSPPILDKRGLLPALSWLAIEHHEKHGLIVTTDFDLGAEPADPVVRTVLFHAVRELLFNIVKHANVRKAEVTVTSSDQSIRIEVRDAGVGFDPVAAGEKSSALGLHSIRERLRLFGGELELIATPGKGARAILRAPLKRVTSAYPAGASLELVSAGPGIGNLIPSAETRPAGRPIKILLVDDHPVLRTSLAEMLAPHAGFSVIAEAGDGLEAVAAALRLQPDVILMDVSMPHLNGIEATRRILAKLPEARVIGFSLHESATMAEAMRDAGAIDYFRKNEPVAVLLEKILSHVHPS